MDLLIRSSMCRHPDPCRSVRDLGLVPARCSLPSAADRRNIATLHETTECGGWGSNSRSTDHEKYGPALRTRYLHGYHGVVPPMALIAPFARMDFIPEGADRCRATRAGPACQRRAVCLRRRPKGHRYRAGTPRIVRSAPSVNGAPKPLPTPWSRRQMSGARSLTWRARRRCTALHDGYDE
jgi:hypothetical protein